ncbi:MAG: tRNA lysidine(34) synthetase TilS [Planctomycetota bacterium]
MDDDSLLDCVREGWLGYRFSDTRCLVGVSGGADSVALLLALLEVHPCRDLVEVGHFNHCWRGAESDADAEWVAEICSRYRVRFHLGKDDSQAPEKSEASARDARYAFLSSRAFAIGARTVVTAHTADDRVETLVHNLFRGSGMAGVAAIGHWRSMSEELLLVRPMLAVTRKQVIAYLTKRGQDFREDYSNQDVSFRRNYIRRSLLPEIRSVYGDGVDGRLLQFADHAADHLRLMKRLSQEYAESVDQLLDHVRLETTPLPRIVFPMQERLTVEWLIAREYVAKKWSELGWPLAAMSASHWNQIREVFESANSINASRIEGEQSSRIRMNLPGDLQLVQHGSWLTINKKTA